MGKRKDKKDPEYIKKKIRKLEEKLRRREASENEPELESQPEPQPEPQPDPQPEPDTEIEVAIGSAEDQPPEEFLLALEGEITDESGEPINSELASRWTKIISDGLNKEQREAIFKKYPMPKNFSAAVAPILNKVIEVSLSESGQKRDKRLINRQTMTGKLLTCIGKSLSNIMKGNINSINLVEELNDAAKIASDLYHTDNTSRKFFALAGASKIVQDACKETKPSKFLFGDNLGEHLKSIQSVKRSAGQIKSTENYDNKPGKVEKPTALPTESTRQRWASTSKATSSDSTGSSISSYTANTEHCQRQIHTTESQLPKTTPPAIPEHYPGCRSAIGEAYKKRGISSPSVRIMLNSLAPNTYKQYDSVLKLWWPFCVKSSKNPYDAPSSFVLSFLTERFNGGASYGTINTTRSALSLLLGSDLGIQDDIKRFMKGVFRSNPPTPKYDVSWDPALVLNYLALSYPNEDTGLEILTKKLATLLALTTGYRVQTLSLILIDNIKYSNSNNVTIHIPDLIKTSKPGTLQPTLHLKSFEQRIEICPVKTLSSYISMTKHIRGNICNLFLTYKKPFHKASTQTISRWIKSTIGKAGVDTSVFTAHSTRHASTSAAKRKGISVDLICKTAGWTQSSSTFAKFYNRPLREDPTSFSSTVCQSATS